MLTYVNVREAEVIAKYSAFVKQEALAEHRTLAESEACATLTGHVISRRCWFASSAAR